MQWVKHFCILKNITEFFLNAWFVKKEMSNNKNLDIIWFAYSRGVQKSLFCCSRPNDTPVMGVCLRHVETILYDWFFLIDFAFVCSEDTKGLTQYLIPLFMANTMVQIVIQYILLFVSYHRFSTRLQIIFPIPCVQIYLSVAATS